jgi:hypothetical protein
MVEKLGIEAVGLVTTEFVKQFENFEGLNIEL